MLQIYYIVYYNIIQLTHNKKKKCVFNLLRHDLRMSLSFQLSTFLPHILGEMVCFFLNTTDWSHSYIKCFQNKKLGFYSDRHCGPINLTNLQETDRKLHKRKKKTLHEELFFSHLLSAFVFFLCIVFVSLLFIFFLSIMCLLVSSLHKLNKIKYFKLYFFSLSKLRISHYL